MIFIWLSADHKTSSVSEWNIIFWIPHLHVLGLKVAVHHEAAHEEVFAKAICQRF